jgi:flavin reductase (DIM6/NTAB) family NADH-FMN oxidoreductase RutF
MIHFNKLDIQGLERIKRLNLINSVTGIKPANLIGSISNDGDSNLAVFSSVIHLGSNPALLGFILRPHQEIRRHTYENIMENGYYSINHVHESFVEQAHCTSAKFEKGVSEFESCHLSEEYLYDFKAPFVRESKLKMGMRFLQSIPIEVNDTVLIIGEIEHLILPDALLDEQGHLDLSLLDDVGIAGLNSYYRLEKIAQFSYMRPDEIPSFNKDTE